METKHALKHDGNKLRYDLIPAYPLSEVARVYTIGAQKYADRNWEKGLTWGRVFAAMMRHAWAWWRGESYDQTDGQHHLASVAWCALALMEYERTHTELDDRVKGHITNAMEKSAIYDLGGAIPLSSMPWSSSNNNQSNSSNTK